MTSVMAAPRNGAGTVGAIPAGAEVYVVRIWDDDAGVAYGQGPYASDLVRGYTQCEGRLRSRQALYPASNYKMVINLSLGSPGPLTVEAAWFERAAQWGDLLFVAASGNNGTDTMQWANYPASYPQVISVAGVDCQGRPTYSSQRGPAVDLAAPGEDVLAASADLARAPRRAWLELLPRAAAKPTPSAAKPTQAVTGGGKAPPSVAKLGARRPPPAAAKNAQSAAASGRAPIPAAVPVVGPYEPRPVQDAPLGAPQRALRIAVCAPLRSGASATSCPPAAAGALCVVPIPGLGAPSDACAAYSTCAAKKAAAVALWSPTDASFDPTYAASRRLNCGLRCACWLRLLRGLRSGGGPPALTLSPLQGRQVTAAAAAGAAARIATYAFPFEYVTGTSAAAAWVSGGAARLWAAFPACNASEVAAAMQATAKDVGSRGRDDAAGAGLLQLADAHRWLQRRACGKSKPLRP